MKRLSVIVCVFVGSMLASAQTSTSAKNEMPQAPAKDPVATSLRGMVSRSQTDTVGALEAMPADKYSYKPTPEQVTFGHLAAHIAEANNLLCSKVADVPAPKVEEAKETDPKDQLVAAVKASYAFCSEALSQMDDSKLGDSVELFGGRKFLRAAAALRLAGGWADHYAAAAMYLRLNGILPPSAKPKE